MDLNYDIFKRKLLSVDENAMVTTIVNDFRPLPTYHDNENLTLIYGPRRDPLFVIIPITVIYMLIFVTGVVGNISTCIVISKNRSMHTATNFYLFSLAVSDFLLLLSGVPNEVHSIWYKWPYVFGEVFCVARGLIAETSANATVLTITSFTVERYLAICHPFLQHTMSKLSRAIRLILIVWVISIGLAIPQALQFGVITSPHGIDQCTLKRIIIEHSFELSTVLFFLTPMTLITILYILIGLKLRTSGLMKHGYGTAMHQRVQVNTKCRQQQTSAGTRRVLKMLVAVVLAFFLCWAPFHAQRLVAFYFADHPLIYATMTYISGVLYYLSTCINPLLYNIMSNKFREAFKETLAKCFKIQKRDHDSHSTYRMLSRRQRRWNGGQESGDYSGSSIRDDCLYSTSTQKQSFDSMTISQCQSKLSFDYDVNNQYSDLNKITKLPKQKLLKSGGGGTKATCPFPKYAFDEMVYNDSDTNLTDKTHEIHISINCANQHKSTKKNDSKLMRFFQSISRWRLHSRHLGYYSPRGTNHSIDTINVRLNPNIVTKNSDVSSHLAQFEHGNRYGNNGSSDRDDENSGGGSGDGGGGGGSGGGRGGNSNNNNDNHSTISNSSIKENNESIKDELTAYMDELRLRELR